jgi:hypothetical protein
VSCRGSTTSSNAEPPSRRGSDVDVQVNTLELMTMDHLTPAQKAGAEMFFGDARGWGFGVGVTVRPHVPDNPTASEGEKEYARTLNAMRKVVFSRTLDQADWHNSTLLRAIMPDEIVALKREAERDVVIYGSASVVQALTRHGLHRHADSPKRSLIDEAARAAASTSARLRPWSLAALRRSNTPGPQCSRGIRGSRGIR